jgi:hypothetical protein
MPLRSLLVASCAITLVVLAQQPPSQQPPGGRGGGFRGPAIAPLAETGFQAIFDGKSLQRWDGDPEFWRVEGGVIVGQTAADKQPAQNTFLIWRGGSPADFELKLEYRLTGHNSGIQIRSVELPDVARWVMKGYQADMDAEQRYTGQFYEERGRGFLALRGQLTYIGDKQRPGLIGSISSNEELKKLIKPDDWNEVWLIARGGTLLQLINGALMSAVVDEDSSGRRLDGLIGIQLHRGPAMKIEVRNVRLKKL